MNQYTNPWTQDEKALVLRLVAEGKGHREIRAALPNRTVGSVTGHLDRLRNAGLAPRGTQAERNKPLTEEQFAQARQMYCVDGAGVALIAKTLKVGRDHMTRTIAGLGWKKPASMPQVEKVREARAPKPREEPPVPSAIRRRAA